MSTGPQKLKDYFFPNNGLGVAIEEQMLSRIRNIFRTNLTYWAKGTYRERNDTSTTYAEWTLQEADK
jgi:hypothetical protein